MNQVSNYVLIGDEMDVKQIGNIVDDSEIGFKNPQRGRIYDTEGLSPALNNCTGGGHEPKVLVKEATKQGYSEIKLGGVMNIAYLDSETRRGRVIDEGETSPTLDTGCKIGMFDGARIRKLTPKECFRLQGFPDEYYERAAKVNSDSQLYKQIGNSVTVPVIYEIAKRL